MDDYQEVTDTIEVPPNTGLEGFLHTVRTLLRLSKVQEIRIDARGTITCRRYAKPNDSDRNLGIDFSELQPSGIVRNTNVEEVAVYEGANAAVVVGGLLDVVAAEQYKPLAFMTGADTVLWDWYRTSTRVSLKNKEMLHGLPLYRDRLIPDTALILVSGYGRDAALSDARRSHKIEMPQYEYPTTEVEVMI